MSWGREQIDELIARWNRGESSAAIGRRLGISPAAVGSKVRRLRQLGVKLRANYGAPHPVMRRTVRAPRAVGADDHVHPCQLSSAGGKRRRHAAAADDVSASISSHPNCDERGPHSTSERNLPREALNNNYSFRVSDIEQLEPHHCRWIDGDPATGRFTWCGRPVVAQTSWCPTCLAKVYDLMPQKRGAANRGEAAETQTAERAA
ncbi:MAG: GcrA family cell cycle regulator [Bacteroidota bacterium]